MFAFIGSPEETNTAKVLKKIGSQNIKPKTAPSRLDEIKTGFQKNENNMKS
jgi:hypothetical protein